MPFTRRILFWAGQLFALKYAKKYLGQKKKLFLLPIVAAVLEFVRQKSEEKAVKKQKQIKEENEELLVKPSRVLGTSLRGVMHCRRSRQFRK